MMAAVYLGVEIGGTKLQVGIADKRGGLKHLARAAVTRSRGRAGILRQLAEIVPGILSRHRVRAIGVGFGGPVDAPRGRVVKSHHVGGWQDFALARWFERRFNLPALLENDSNCAALAEALCGAGRGKRAVLYVNVGTGIGGGLVVDGGIYSGRFGALEIGHTRMQVDGNWRTLESVASGLAIERGISTVAQAAKHVGAALANAVSLLNPDIVVVGGGVAQAGERFLRPLRATAARLVFEPFRANHDLVPAALGESVVVVGAALLAARGR